MRRLAMVLVALFLVCGSVVHAGEEKASMENPLRTEMRLLDEAFKNLIDSLLLNHPEGIEEPFHAVHEAKHHTEKALEEGRVILPKNGDKIREFQEMDEKFHETLKELIMAAGKKDMEAVRQTTHRVLDGCVRCHSRFRE